MTTIRLEIRKPIAGHRIGDVVTVHTDARGTPLLEMWRDRMADAVIDDCVAEVKPLKKKVSTKDRPTQIDTPTEQENAK